jgi:hypothetical protein
MYAPKVTGNVGTLAERKRFVSALYGGYALFCFAVTVGLRLQNPVRIVGLATLLLSFGLMWWGFFSLTGLLFGNKAVSDDPDHDAILQARRDTIKRRARPITIAVIALAALYLVAGMFLYPVAMKLPIVLSIVLGAFLVATTLPATMVAWTEPDYNPSDIDPYAVIDHNIPSIKLLGK